MANSVKKTPFIILLIGALGIVYGDIGASPLYAVNEIFFGHGHLPLTTQTVLGSISLVVWILTLIVTLKYVAFVLLADREGQGGVFALLGLLTELKKRKSTIALTFLLVLAAGLLFGEGLITPAISLLAAVEGLVFIAPAFQPLVMPIALVILTVLFFVQYKGSAKVGIIFGPIMIMWFVTIGLLGVYHILRAPEILQIFNPTHAFTLLVSLSATKIFFLFSAVILAVAGVEALYADMGHFGSRPIRISWVFFVYPALILNYLGQGALLLSNSVVNNNIFYSLVPKPFLIPMVILATATTIIASQALISGAYSLVAQAVALNYLPRFRIVHTNKVHEGQIYVPAVNWLLYIGAAGFIVLFQSSTNLAAAYGITAAGIMFITSLGMFALSTLYWQWHWLKSLAVFAPFALIDAVFFVSTSMQFMHGGFVPVILGLVLFVIMTNWHWGRDLIAKAYESYSGQRKISYLLDLKAKLEKEGGVVVDDRGQFVEAGRTVVFLINRTVLGPDDQLPILVRAYMRQNGAIPKYCVLLHINRSRRPFISSNRYTVVDLGHNIHSVEAQFGFMERISLERVMSYLRDDVKLSGLSYDRYMIEAGEDTLKVDDEHSSLFVEFSTRFFRMLQMIAAPTYRYFGVKGNISLTTTVMPIYVSDLGGVIKLPELDLVETTNAS